MNHTDRLDLHHELLLLTLKDEEGVPEFGSSYSFGMGGAMLAELLLRGRIEVEEDRKRKFLKLIDKTPVGDPALDAALLKMAAAKRRATLQTWVMRLGTQNLKHVVAGELCRRHVLRADEDKVLLIFTRKIYPELDPRPEREIVQRLRDAIYRDNSDVEPRTAILVSLGNSSNVLKNVFPKAELKNRKARIEQIAKGEATGAATLQAVQAAQAAAVMAAIMPALIVTTTTSH
jgi:Golgi phosphoprotein 3